jgi:putative glycosyltransferase
MKLSIVTTLFCSARHLEEFHQRSSAAAVGLVGDDYELVLVNDGSPDESLDIALKLVASDPHVVVVDLSRNFGHYKAMMTGLAASRGDLVFLIDSDLEEAPELLQPFASQLNDEQCDVVFGVQESRKGKLFERVSGEFFWRCVQMLTGTAIPRNLSTVRLMTRRYVEALVEHQEREIFMAGLWQITGFDQRSQTITKHSSSPTTYTLRTKLALLVNTITSFSNAPLRMIFYTGTVIFVCSLSYISYLIAHWMLGAPPSGWTSVVASVWLLGGLIISFIGVLGIYLSKIFSEVKQRPYTIVRATHRHDTEYT